MSKFRSSQGRSFSRVATGVMIYGASVISMLAFQNCSAPAPGSGVDSNSSYAGAMELAYDATVDHIAYMSCSRFSPGADQSAYFTIRAGAFGAGGGVRMSPAYFTHGDNPKKTQVRLADYLTESPQNSNTLPQLAVRPTGQYQSAFSVGGGNPQPNKDYSNMFTPLGSPDVSTVLVESGATRVKRVRLGDEYGSRMEARLDFGSSWEAMFSIRNLLASTSAMLTLTYTGSRGDSSARSPRDFNETSKYDQDKSVFGRGYTLSFRDPMTVNPLHNANQPPYTVVLNAVTETNLLHVSDRGDYQKNPESKSWTCPTNLVFRIVPPRDIANANCVKRPDPEVLTDELKRVRHLLRHEDWYVDLANRCIIPKKPGTEYACYNGAMNVKYDKANNPTQGGGTANNYCYTDPSNPSQYNPVCVAYASVCYRNP